MYEFSFNSAVNASIKSIQEDRENLLQELADILGDKTPGRRGRKKKEDEKLFDYEQDRMREYIELYDYIKNGFNVVIEVDKLKNEEIKLSK